MKMTSLIMSPDFQIYLTKGHGAQLYYVDVHKLQWICSGVEPGIFCGSGGFGEKGHNIWKML